MKKPARPEDQNQDQDPKIKTKIPDLTKIVKSAGSSRKRAKPVDPNAALLVAFREWAYWSWCQVEGIEQTNGKAWSTTEWVRLTAGYKSLGDDALARRSWGNYLRDGNDFYLGHYPRKWAVEPARWLRRRAGLSPRTAKNIDAMQAYLESKRHEEES